MLETQKDVAAGSRMSRISQDVIQEEIQEGDRRPGRSYSTAVTAANSLDGHSIVPTPYGAPTSFNNPTTRSCYWHNKSPNQKILRRATGR